MFRQAWKEWQQINIRDVREAYEIEAISRAAFFSGGST
jgi:hypothetical protein